jgi:uncharacterized protein (DUF433 family)
MNVVKDVQLSEEFPRIVANPGRLGGKPCIKDTRISVMHVLEVFASGGDIEDFKRGYPEVPEEGVRQAILYAADRMSAAAVEAAPAH